MHPPGRLRWAVDVTRWIPTDVEFDFLCRLLPDQDAEEVKRFRFPEDRRRALLSRLMQREASARGLRLAQTDVEVRRTRGRKPYAANRGDRTKAPNFNFSVSHEGDYVVLASEQLIVCGCDIAAPHQLRRGNKKEPLVAVLEAFKGQLTQNEWKYVFLGVSAGDTNTATVGSTGDWSGCRWLPGASGRMQTNDIQWPPPYAQSVSVLDDEFGIDLRFRQIWSLKEAFVKATGEGLGFDLCRAAFTIDINNKTARVSIDGVPKDDWVFHLHCLGTPGRDHWISVARGPISAIVDAWGVRGTCFTNFQLHMIIFGRGICLIIV